MVEKDDKLFYQTNPFSDDQARLLIDSEQQYSQWLYASQKANEYAGWVTFKKVGEKEYLVHGQSGGLNQRSLGLRSAETESKHDAFVLGKQESKMSLEAIESRLNERAPMLKSVKLPRLLSPLANVVRQFDTLNMLGSQVMVAGTHAISAYETLAGRWFDSSLTGTEDLDFVWLGRTQEMEMVINSPSDSNANEQAAEPLQLIKILQQVDNSYVINAENNFQARNSKGFIIDFITSHTLERDDKAALRGLRPIGIDGQDWLMLKAPITSTVVDTNGWPAKLSVPDPRIFALHKLWVSEQTNRNEKKVTKDRKQGIAVSALVINHLPGYPFNKEFLNSIPEPLQKMFDKYVVPLMPKPGVDKELMAEKIRNIATLKDKAGAEYTFYEVAMRALSTKSADDIDWKKVEEFTIRKSIAEDGQPQDEVLNTIKKYSPGILTEDDEKQITQKVELIAPMLKDLYEARNGAEFGNSF